MQQNLSQTISLLTATPATFNSLLRTLPDSWTLSNEGEDSWSAFDVLGHLVQVEKTDWIPRLELIQKFGESRALEPVARTAFLHDSHRKPLSELLDEFAALRAENLTQLRAMNLQPQDFVRPGKHRVFGPITLSHLLSTWAIHDLTHLHQITRILAHQYRDAVGPFSRFLGVLHCSGHSS